jgi:indole-3-glycerol phosphate synthase
MQTAETGTVLDRIVAQTRIDLDARKQLISRDELQRRFETIPAPVDVASALRQDTVTVIAEIKRASPSRGWFPVEFEPADVAREYLAGGAAMISCLTDGPFFQGSLADLDAVVAVTGTDAGRVGVLRKDFMIDEYQIDEARAHGASCILLIAACLTDEHMGRLHTYATALGLSSLIEVHDEEELTRALALEPRLIGVNNRNLKTLEVRLDVTRRLARLVPGAVVLVGESGIFTREHAAEMGAAGADAILVGESLIVQHDRQSAAEALTGVGKTSRD